MNKRLLMLNGLAILAVVMNHASHSGFIAMFWWTDRYRAVTVPNFDQTGSFGYYQLVAAQKLALFSVPAFLFTTGVFLAYAARGAQTRLTWSVVLRRIYNLLPAYLIWTAIYFVVASLLGNQFTPAQYLLGFVTVAYSPFFFVPLIIVYYLLSVYLAPLAKQKPALVLSIAAFVLLLGIVSGYARQYAKLNGIENTILTGPASYFFERQIFEYFFYYVLGLVTGFYQAELKAFVTRYRWAFLALTVIAGALAVAEAEWMYRITDTLTDWRSRTLTLPTVIYAISFILMFLGFEQFPLPKFLYNLGTNTLGIYLIHRTVLLILPKIVYHALPFVLGIQPLYQPLLIAIAVGVPLVMMLLTRKLPLKTHYRLLYG